MELPTATDILAWTKVDLAALGYPAAVDLDDLVAQAVAYVEQVTGRIPLSAVPPELEPLARQAVRMRVEQIAEQATEENVEEASEELVQSFTTPGYSENRYREARNHFVVVLNDWRALNDVLLLLMTPERRDEYLGYLTGQHVPAMALTQVDWQYDYLYWPQTSSPDWGWGQP